MKVLSLISAVFILSAASLEGQVRFTSLGYLNNAGTVSKAQAALRDGSKLTGYSYSPYGTNLPCLWQSSDHWQSGTINYVAGTNTLYNYETLGISADGNVLVGYRQYGGAAEAIYWIANQFQTVPFPSAQTSAQTAAVSGDGRYVAGLARAQVPGYPLDYYDYKAFWWDRTQGAAVFLSPYPGSPVANAQANAVSDDGRRVAGWVQLSASSYAAARWDDRGLPVLLSNNGDPVVATFANGITPDGSIIVGAAANGIPFKWTAAGGAVALPMPTNDGGQYQITSATALAVSGNGRVIVGTGENDHGGTEALYWDETGRHRVAATANLAGQLPPSWETFEAFSVDYFGNTICGYGRGSSGAFEGYVLVLNAGLPPPALAAPVARPTYDAAAHKLTVSYQTLPGLKYRVLGADTVAGLAPLTGYSAGLGDYRSYSVTNNGSKYFLRVEVATN